MRNRVINLFVQGVSFRLRTVIILIILYLVFLSWEAIQSQDIEMVNLNQKLMQAKATVAQIPQMENQLKALQEHVGSLQSKSQKVDFTLNGILIKDNVPVALIGEDMYSENDSIDEFIVKKINSDSVILVNKRTLAEKIIRLPE